jgi:hypothetical protein
LTAKVTAKGERPRAGGPTQGPLTPSMQPAHQRTDQQVHPLQRVCRLLLVRPTLRPAAPPVRAAGGTVRPHFEFVRKRAAPVGGPRREPPALRMDKGSVIRVWHGRTLPRVGSSWRIPGGSRRCARVVRASPQDPQPRGCASRRHGCRPGRSCQRYSRPGVADQPATDDDGAGQRDPALHEAVRTGQQLAGSGTDAPYRDILGAICLLVPDSTIRLCQGLQRPEARRRQTDPLANRHWMQQVTAHW